MFHSSYHNLENVSSPAIIFVFLQKLIVICLSGGDDRDPSKTSVKASSAAILARLLVMNTNSLAQLTSDPSTSLLLQTASIPVQENILLCLVDIWVDKVGVVMVKRQCLVLNTLPICVFFVLRQTCELHYLHNFKMIYLLSYEEVYLVVVIIPGAVECLYIPSCTGSLSANRIRFSPQVFWSILFSSMYVSVSEVYLNLIVCIMA